MCIIKFIKVKFKYRILVVEGEAICTGSLAGHNAARNSIGMYLLQLPTSIAIGDFISYANKELKEQNADRLKFTFAGSVYFNRMKELDFYTTDKKVIENRVKQTGLAGIFNKKIIR